MLQPYDVTFCFDNDKYGQEALHKFSAYKKSFHGGKSTTVGFVLPPTGFKDWNDLLIHGGAGALNYYVTSQEKQLDWGDFMRMRLRL
jgi:DNA primase